MELRRDVFENWNYCDCYNSFVYISCDALKLVEVPQMFSVILF